jgi:hypothetical protein
MRHAGIMQVSCSRTEQNRTGKNAMGKDSAVCLVKPKFHLYTCYTLEGDSVVIYITMAMAYDSSIQRKCWAGMSKQRYRLGGGDLTPEYTYQHGFREAFEVS